MDKDKMKLYLNRWKTLSGITKTENTNMSFSDKVEKTFSVSKLGFELGFSKRSKKEEEEIYNVRKRWNLLKKGLHAKA